MSYLQVQQILITSSLERVGLILLQLGRLIGDAFNNYPLVDGNNNLTALGNVFREYNYAPNKGMTWPLLVYCRRLVYRYIGACRC